MDKSFIYMLGVRDDLRTEVLNTLGLIERALSFKYLGVPLSLIRTFCNSVFPSGGENY